MVECKPAKGCKGVGHSFLKQQRVIKEQDLGNLSDNQKAHLQPQITAKSSKPDDWIFPRLSLLLLFFLFLLLVLLLCTKVLFGDLGKKGPFQVLKSTKAHFGDVLPEFGQQKHSPVQLPSNPL